jgi:micrococcal nuclease
MHILTRKYIICALALALAGGVSACNYSTEGGYHARVVYVYDGDTIKLDNGENVRYLGIDTPEMNYKKPPAERFAEQAKRFNEQLVAQKKVRLEFDAQRRDKYDRLLAYVYVDDIFVNAEILKQGYGKVYIIPPNVKYADEFLALQREAKAGKKGIWQP